MITIPAKFIREWVISGIRVVAAMMRLESRTLKNPRRPMVELEVARENMERARQRELAVFADE
jgi:hypothetical protein